MSTNDSLDSVVLQKEKEWREAFQLRVKKLEETIKQRDKELKQERLKFLKLKEDFEYNLKLLTERDQELENYDSVFSQIKETEHFKTSEVSELCARIDDLKLKLDNEERAKEELQKHYQKRLQEYQNEFVTFRKTKDCEIDKEREELASCRRNLDSQLRMAEDNFEFWRQELVSHFDQTLKKQEQEYRAKLDKTSSLLLSNNIKIRSLTKELELVRTDSSRCKEELNETEVNTQELEKMIKEKDWMIADLKSTHEYYVADLVAQLENMKKSEEKMSKEFQKKSAELDRRVHEREEMLLNTKQGFAEEERKLGEKIRMLENQLVVKDQENRQNEWQLVDKVKKNEVTIETLQQSVTDLKTQLAKEKEELWQQTVAKDLELEKLLQQEAKLRTELAKRKDDLERRQKELNVCLEKERLLERSKAQLELDWQRRCEEAERTGYEKQDELVKNLTLAKEEGYSLVKEQERNLRHKDNVIRAVTRERDDAIAALRQNGLDIAAVISREGIPDEPPLAADTTELKAQNETLVQIIRQMREDMEDLTKQLDQRHGNSSSEQSQKKPAICDEYVTSLEKEIRDVKARNRELRQSLEDFMQDANVIEGSKHEGRLRFHQSNDTIDSLREEKLQLTSQVRKNEKRIIHLQDLLHRSNNELSSLKVDLSSQGYALPSLNKLNKIIGDLRHENERVKKELNNQGRIVNGHSGMLQEKLREASQRINELSKEREHLIQMGNKLRAELIKYKDCESSDSASHPQRRVLVEPSNLENMEKLTSKELPYAQTHSNRGDSVSYSVNNMKSFDMSSEDVKHTKADDIISPWQPSFSSDDRSSLQEVWKLLDEDSPAGATPRVIHNGHAQESNSNGFTVKGYTTHVQIKPENRKPTLSAKAAGKWKPTQARAKIRNYNIRNDDIREGL